MLIDAHCHIADEGIENFHKIQTILRAEKLCVMSSEPSQWTVVEALLVSEFNHRIIPAFGIHPWHVKGISVEAIDSLMAQLEALLVKYPNALVGEIGLDSVAIDRTTGQLYDQALQLILFKHQWDLAAKYNRSVSVHCVKAFAILHDAIRENLTTAPIKIMMHSYTGSFEFAMQLMRLPHIGSKFYFSYSTVINLRSWKCKKIIKELPDDRILVESDVSSYENIDSDINEMLAVIKSAKKWTIEETIDKIANNSETFFY